jgi:uncharacterized protein YuzE
MKVNYHPETDSLYIDLSEQPSVESLEISEGVVLDYDESGNLVGIDIDNASRKVELQRFVVSRIPARVDGWLTSRSSGRASRAAQPGVGRTGD